MGVGLFILLSYTLQLSLKALILELIQIEAKAMRSVS